jgi:hypothetical protein
MDKKEKNRVERFLVDYFKNIHKVYTDGDFREESFQKSSELSVELAKKTRFLEHILQEELLKDNEEVTRFYKAFQEELIETLTKERFSDLYAQTITYGLFAARMKVQNGFNRETAWKSIPESLPLLKEIFYSMTGPHFPESLIWIVDDIAQILKKADIPAILKEFKAIRWEDDPVIHFYETFLGAYNPGERERLGVYYTPLPVVSYIVRSIHKLLKDGFSKPEGLATSDVTLLDPAAGTLTFVVQAVGAIHELPLQGKSETRRMPSFNPEFLKALKESLSSGPSPEGIFYYIYAVLYSPAYRKRYEEFLKIDFPRVPLPLNVGMFKDLGNLGRELVDLHLLKHPDLEKTEVGFPKSSSNKVEKVSYIEERHSVFINKEQYFEGVSNEVWEYRIGAYLWRNI